MKAEVISIGTELLLGHIINTNAAFLSRRLAELGIDVYRQTTVGDNPARLEGAIKEALARAEIVVTSGGLGPTIDDITMRSLGRFAGRKIILENRVGTAPGLILEPGHQAIIALPGPPRELEPMFVSVVTPYLKKRFRIKEMIVSRLIKTTGLAEIKVDGMLKGLLKLQPPTTVGIYAKLGEVDLKIMSKAPDRKTAARSIAGIEKKIRARLASRIFGCDDETLEGAVGKALLKKKKTLAVAESCTGGFVSHRITNVSGSSKYFRMGVVAYPNDIKESMLGISQRLMKEKGAVSKEVAIGMARGARLLGRSDIGIGITGIAGPTGGNTKKPVGLVYIALADGRKEEARECRFKGSREDIKFQASQVALDMVRCSL